MPNTEDIIQQIEKYRKQSLYYMIALILGVGISILLYLQLQNKKQELESTQAALQETLNDLGVSENNNAELQETIADLKKLNEDLKSFGKDHWPNENLNARQVIKKLHNETEQRRKRPTAKKTRSALIQELFSTNENVRKEATDDLLKYYQNEPNLISGLLQATKGKINLDNRNSIYQILYILENLDNESLAGNKVIIAKFLKAAESANLIGNQSSPRVQGIRSRMQAG